MDKPSPKKKKKHNTANPQKSKCTYALLWLLCQTEVQSALHY